jgi:PAS domain S-box-containing protein
MKLEDAMGPVQPTADLHPEYLRAAMDSLADGIALVDAGSLNCLYINHAGVRMLGAQAHDLADSMRLWCDTAVAQSPSPLVETREIRANEGTRRWLEISRCAAKAGGQWIVTATIRDVTRQKAQNTRLERYRTALDQAGEAILLIDAKQLEYVGVNEAAARMAGKTREEMSTLGPLDFIRATGTGVTAEQLRAAYPKLIASYPAPEVFVERYERDQGLLGYFETTRRAVRVAGRWLIAAVIRDVTERHVATQRHERLSAAINEAEDGIHVVDVQSMTYVDANPAAARLFGMTRDEMITLGPIGVALRVEGLAEPAVRDRYQEAIACFPEAVSGVRDLRLAGGNMRTIEFTRRALRPDDRWVVVTVVRDVTERMAGQRRLAQLEAAIDQAADAILVIDPETLTYLHINKTCEQLLGMSRERMAQLGVGGVVRELGLGSPEDTRRTYRELIDMHPQGLTMVRKVIRPDGTTVDEESTRRAVQVDGKWMILLVSRDVTQRLALQLRLEQLRAAVNEATDMVLVIDPQAMEFVEINEAAARNYGLTRDAMLRMGLRRVTHFIGAWTYGQVAGHYADLIANYPAPSTAMGAVLVEGHPEKIIESTRRAVQMEGKWLIITIGRDVTAREHARRELHQRVEELARSNRDLEQFAYVTSHDLSEPLRMVASYTQLLARRYGTHFDDDGREFMGYVVTGAQRMKQLIDDLLLYSRAGRSTAELKEVPLDKALDAALANLAHAIRDSAASIARPAVLPTLMCDKSGMTQVFQNLVANAIKFKGEAPPVIRIEAVRDGQDWIISVADNGIGIEPQYFDRIFVIFQRLHARAEYEGTGIGLAICKRIVERHEGAIWVESTVGQGTSFKLRLTAR